MPDVDKAYDISGLILATGCRDCTEGVLNCRSLRPPPFCTLPIKRWPPVFNSVRD
jgi:hypothetical protein